MPEPTEAERERARKWIQEHLTGPNSDPAIPGTGWPAGIHFLASLLAEVRAEERPAVYREPDDAGLHHAYSVGVAEGRAERDKHWLIEAQQAFEDVREWTPENSYGFDDPAVFTLHEVWKRDARVVEAKAEGAREEREAVVKWIRHRAPADGWPHDWPAREIERGYHHKKQEPSK